MKLVWSVSPELFAGSAPLSKYAVFFAVAAVGALLWVRRHLRRSDVSARVIWKVAAVAAPAALVGARVAHCLIYDRQRCCAPSPWEALRFWHGGLASHGALVGLVVALAALARCTDVRWRVLVDAGAPAAAWCAIWVRLGNFANSEVVGRATDGSWGVRFPYFDGFPAAAAPLRHPVQLYESALGLVTLALLLALERRAARRPGLLAAALLVIYFGGRVALERFKEYQALPEGALLTAGQLLSLPVAAAGAAWLVWIRRRGPGERGIDGERAAPHHRADARREEQGR